MWVPLTDYARHMAAGNAGTERTMAQRPNSSPLDWRPGGPLLAAQTLTRQRAESHSR